MDTILPERCSPGSAERQNKKSGGNPKWKKYYRITAYHPTEDCCFIVDSHSRFEKLWQFSAYLVSKGVKVLEVANSDTFLDGNMNRAKEHPEYIYLQSEQRGQPTRTTVTVDGKTYRAVEICGRRYVPDRNEVVR